MNENIDQVVTLHTAAKIVTTMLKNREIVREVKPQEIYGYATTDKKLDVDKFAKRFNGAVVFNDEKNNNKLSVQLVDVKKIFQTFLNGKRRSADVNSLVEMIENI